MSLHICPECDSDLVQPTRWVQSPKRNGYWKLERRCPECEWRGEDVYGPISIDDYDEALDLGTQKLQEVLKDLERENMRHFTDVFTRALEDDLITAADF